MEDLAKMRHSMSGCPPWYPTRLADDSAMRTHFLEDQWPLLMTSYQSNLMGSTLIGVVRLRQVHPNNPQHANSVNLNDLGFAEPSRAQNQCNVWIDWIDWIDWVSGAVVRQGLPARMERV